MKLTANAAPHFHFVSWSDGSTENPRMLTLVRDTSLIAIFAIDTLHIEISPNDIMRGNATGSGDYVYGGMVKCTATAYSGYKFSCWSNGVTHNPYTFAATAPINLVAVFVENNSDGIIDISNAFLTVTTYDGFIFVRNAVNQRIRIFDCVGRCLSSIESPNDTYIYEIHVSGVYFVKVGESRVQKVVVLR